MINSTLDSGTSSSLRSGVAYAEQTVTYVAAGRRRVCWPWLLAGSLAVAQIIGQPLAHAQAATSEWGGDVVVVFSEIGTAKSAFPVPAGLAEAVHKDLAIWLRPAKLVITKQCAAGDIECLRAVKIGGAQGFALKVEINRTAKDTFYVSLTLASMKDASQLEPRHFSVSLFEVPQGTTLESVLVKRLGTTAAELLRKMALPIPIEASRVAKPAPLATAAATMTVELAGSGSVQSVVDGIDCGTRCTASFREPVVTLIAKPGLGRGVREWGGAECRSSGEIFPSTQWPCTLALPAGQKLNLAVRFGYTRRRQVIAGVFGVLAGASLVSSLVLLGLQNQPAGIQTVDGVTGMYNYNVGRYGLIGLGATVGFGLGLVLPLVMPEKRGN